MRKLPDSAGNQADLQMLAFDLNKNLISMG
jgi:hypothetical protein